MATKGALSSLPKLTPAYGLEEGQTDDAVERATDRVMQAYAARQNLGYDPTLMAFGQAMLASRGNFAEGLGAGLKGAQEAQQLNRQQDIEEAQAGLTMAQAQREQQNAQRAASAFAQVTGAPSAKPTGPLSSEAGQQGKAPAGMQPITLEIAKNFMDAFPKDTERNKFLMEAAKLYQGRFLMGDQGVFDTMANGGRGAFVDLPMRNQKPSDYSTVAGTITMTPAKNDLYQNAVDIGLGKEWVDSYKAGQSTNLIDQISAGKKGIMAFPPSKEVMEGQTFENPKVVGPAAVAEPVSVEKKAGTSQDSVSVMLSKPPSPKGILSKEEIEAAQVQRALDKDIALKEAESGIRLREETQKTTAAQETARKAEFKTKADVAKDAVILARQFRKLSEDPSADKIMGTFSNNKIFSAIINLLETGVGTRTTSIGIPEIAPIVRNLDLDEKEMRTAQILGMLIANMQLAKGKMLSGNVSNYDAILMGKAGIVDKDTRLSVRAKADMLERQAQYNEDLDEAMDEWKGTVSAFNRSKKFQTIREKFIEDLTGIAVGEVQLSSPPVSKPSVATPPAPAPAGKKRDVEGAATKLK